MKPTPEAQEAERQRLRERVTRLPSSVLREVVEKLEAKQEKPA